MDHTEAVSLIEDARGDMFVLEELKPGAFDDDPPKAFAARFLVAWCNDDRDTTLALFNAALESIDSGMSLLADAARKDPDPGAAMAALYEQYERALTLLPVETAVR